MRTWIVHMSTALWGLKGHRPTDIDKAGCPYRAGSRGMAKSESERLWMTEYCVQKLATAASSSGIFIGGDSHFYWIPYPCAVPNEHAEVPGCGKLCLALCVLSSLPRWPQSQPWDPSHPTYAPNIRLLKRIAVSLRLDDMLVIRLPRSKRKGVYKGPCRPKCEAQALYYFNTQYIFLWISSSSLTVLECLCWFLLNLGVRIRGGN